MSCPGYRARRWAIAPLRALVDGDRAGQGRPAWAADAWLGCGIPLCLNKQIGTPTRHPHMGGDASTLALTALIFLAALLYASVGHGGASGLGGHGVGRASPQQSCARRRWP